MTEAERLAAGLPAVLTRWLGEPATVSELYQLSGGASRETWSLVATTSAGKRKLILRRDPPEAPRAEQMALEASVLTETARVGVPVPALIGHGDGSDEVGSAYLLMEHLEGETFPRRLLREPRWEKARAGLAAELGRALAAIHQVPLDNLPDLTGGDALEQLRAAHDAFDEPHPALEVAFRWLAENRPPASEERLVHGDFRNGNLMLGDDGLVAVLDWELVHRGDPVEDLGWLCGKAWRFGATRPVGGFGDRDELLDGYAEVAGWRPTEETLRWWEAFGVARWAVICREQAERHLGGTERSVEMAVLGRRLSECEHDVLLTLGLTETSTVDDPLVTETDSAPGLHGRPTIDELLAATADYLDTDVVGSDSGERLRFHARVAANAMKIARRELRVGEAQRAAHQRRLDALGCADDRALVDAIRDGSLDSRWDEVLDTVRALVVAKLTVANPRYLSQPWA
ncbi:phosphotransferase family protein [Pseudonocardia spinosispora]|uniref:phosphotransferase family protein n=1 Tax=Pseudonocardia spinosispora TaxID=103441 RepID=UPI0003F9B45F|nr:phosphotransferase family protein [Pseudonocardia spinosispora]